MRSRNLTWVVLLVSVIFAIAAPILAQEHRGGGQAVRLQTYTGEFLDHATYLIEVPENWNGTLFLYSHGYVFPGDPNPASVAPCNASACPAYTAG